MSPKPPRLSTDDPSSFGQEVTLDNRWTLSKLAAAGYEFKGDGPCKTCGESVAFYKREQAGDYKGWAKWRIVDPASLEVHACRGRR